MSAASGSVSSTSTVGRIAVKVWRSSALAGTTSTPPGQRSRSRPSAAARSGVELVTRDQLLDRVRSLSPLIPVLVCAVRDLRLLIVVDGAARALLDDLVPDGLRRVALLRAHLVHVEAE